jgi:type II secretion system protein J
MIFRGFTLLEVLIALLVAALISIMSFDFLSNTIFLKERVDTTIEKDSQHSKAIHTLRLDMIQAVPFKMKDENFNNLNVSLIGSNNERILTFVSLNTNDLSPTRSNLRRVIYLYKDNQLTRKTTLANNENVVLSENVLLKDISNLNILFGDEITDLLNYYPTLSTANNIHFPDYVYLTYQLGNQEFKQILGFYK